MRVAGLVIVFFAAPGVRAFLSSGIVMSVDTSQFVGMSECPRIGLGLAALGRPGYINLQRNAEIGDKESRSVEAMREQSYQVMDAAWASGIRYFDAARSYGKAEEFLEGWLRSRKIAPSEVAVGSKWGYRYTADWRIDTGNEPHEVKDHSAAHFQTQQAETLGLLSEYLNLYQIHSATIESGVLEDAAGAQPLPRAHTCRRPRRCPTARLIGGGGARRVYLEQLLPTVKVRISPRARRCHRSGRHIRNKVHRR